jgi:hypothetical protein
MLPNENIFGETSNTFSKYKEVSAEDIEKTAENMNDIQQRIAKDVLENVTIAQKKQKMEFDKRKNVAVNEFHVGEFVLVKNQRRKKGLGKSLWLGPFKISNIPRTGTMTLEDKNCEAIGNYREHNLKKCYPAENEKQQEDERQENENGNEMNGQKGHSENDNNEKQLEDEREENKNGNEMNGQKGHSENDSETDENNNDNTTDDQLENEDNMFITQSSFTPNESVQFDIDVNHIFEVGSSPQKEVDIEEQTRPKRQCCGKNRRNSISLF